METPAGESFEHSSWRSVYHKRPIPRMLTPRPGVTTSRACFARDYELGRFAAMRDLERSVLGSDYGGTSWTTRREAGQIAELLGLRAGMRLLDVGAGAGWPGLYLAQVTGCDVVLTDRPFVGLQIALERSATDRRDDGICAIDPHLARRYEDTCRSANQSARSG